MRSVPHRIGLCLVVAFGGACATSHSSPGGTGGATAGSAASGDSTDGATVVGAAGDTGVAGETNLGTTDTAGGAGAAGAQVDASPVDVAPEAAPTSPIDFSIWQLQLPAGIGTSPTTLAPAELVAGFSDTYFYREPSGGQMFMDPATGITTSGSQHCRTELREMTPDGKPAAWPSTSTNTMTVSGKILQVGGGASGHVTIGQVFNGTDSIPLCELEYSAKIGGFQLLYEEGKGAGTTTDLAASVALGEPYTFTLALSNGTLTVGVSGKVVFTKTPSAAVAANNFYFKAGNYDQTAIAGSVSTTPYTVVEVDALEVGHR
jgi:hypothetical protein